MDQVNAPWNQKYRQVRDERKRAIATAREKLANTQPKSDPRYARKEVSDTLHRAS